MSKVNNLIPIERIIHQVFHDIADKHDIDVDLVAEIIEEFDNEMSKRIRCKPIIHLN